LVVMQGDDSTKSLHVARTADTILTITQLTAATAVAVNVIDYASLEIREYS